MAYFNFKATKEEIWKLIGMFTGVESFKLFLHFMILSSFFNTPD